MATKTIKLSILLIILAIASLSTVNAGNNTTIVDNPIMVVEDALTVEALESGDSNISFTDGYKGYCIEWGEHSAEAGDKFYVHEDVDNNIKVFFTYFYKESQKDTIATQHMIWKFTDNKQFSRFNQTLYNQIINVSKNIKVPNEGTLKINNTTEMVFSFKNFVSPISQYQNYFGYKIFFRNITHQINESSTNNITPILPQLYNYESNFTFNEIIINKNNNLTHISTSNSEKTLFSKHITGVNPSWLFICVIFMIFGIIIIRT